jgi:hypothetical protein
MKTFTTKTLQATVSDLVRAIAGQETGRRCRVCGEPIATKDCFGMSEGVCRACRGPE